MNAYVVCNFCIIYNRNDTFMWEILMRTHLFSRTHDQTPKALLMGAQATLVTEVALVKYTPGDQQMLACYYHKAFCSIDKLN